jgi:hypothetical protein
VSGDPRIYPLPEAIAARRYDIVEGYGTCNNVTGVLSVPLDGSPLSRRVQAHEIAHANWSPTKPKRPSGLPDVAIQRAEDLRMNLLTTRAGAGDALQASLADRDGQDPVRFYLSFARSRLQAYTAACATVGTGDFEPLLAALAAVNPELAAEARYIAESAWVAMDEIDEPSFEDALRLALKLDQLSESPPPPPGGEPDPSDDESDESGDDDGDDNEPDNHGGDADDDADADDDGDERDERPDEQGESGDDDDDEAEADEGDDKAEADDGDSADDDSDGDGDESSDESGDADDADDGDDDDDAAADVPADDGDDDGAAGDEDDGLKNSTEREGPARDTSAKPPPSKSKGPSPLDMSIEVDLDDVAMDDVDLDADDGFMTRDAVIAEEEIDDVEAAVRAMEKLMGRYRGHGVESGTMTINQPPRTKRLPARLIGRKTTAASEGTAPRFMNRYCSDGAIFSARAKRPGQGTVLFDVSGSMSLPTEAVQELMEQLPAGTIANYSGQGSKGILTILAKNGRRVEDDQICAHGGYGNVVDEPALEWLAKQGEPRLWVCDGVVTGKGDNPSAAISRSCAAICRRAKVLRLPTLADLNNWLDKTKAVDRKRAGR